MKHSLLGPLSYILGLCTVLGLASEPAMAAGKSESGGFFFDETFAPVYVNKNDTSSFNTSPGVATESGMGIDARTTLGYTIAGQYLFGFTYNTYSLTTSRASVVGGDSGKNESTSSSEMGPTLGYLNNGWRVILTYFISGEKSRQTKDLDDAGATSSDVTIKNTKGTGLQFTVGYSYAVGAHFEIGPSLIYKSITYANQSKTKVGNAAETYADAALFTAQTESTLTPMLSMSLRF